MRKSPAEKEISPQHSYTGVQELLILAMKCLTFYKTLTVFISSNRLSLLIILSDSKQNM
jgi:hypothetical protein